MLWYGPIKSPDAIRNDYDDKTFNAKVIQAYLNEY